MTDAMRLKCAQDASRWILSVVKAVEDELDHPWPNLRVCTAVWYIAGILYERDQTPCMEDFEFDELSKYLLGSFGEAVAMGADALEREALAAGTAMGWEGFPQQYFVYADAWKEFRL